MRLPLSALVAPTDVGLPYVRGRVKEAWVQELAGLIRRQGFRPDRPITVYTIPKPAEDDKGLLPAAYRDGKRAVVLVGRHRWLACAALAEAGVRGYTDIPVVRWTPKSADTLERDAVVEQLRSDGDHGLKIDLDVRDATVIALREQYTMTEREIARVAGYAPSTIHRILKAEQHGAGRKRRKAREDRAERASAPAWTCEDFTTRLLAVAGEAKAHKAALTSFYGSQEHVPTCIALRAFAATLDTITGGAAT